MLIKFTVVIFHYKWMNVKNSYSKLEVYAPYLQIFNTENSNTHRLSVYELRMTKVNKPYANGCKRVHMLDCQKLPGVLLLVKIRRQKKM